MCLLCSTDISLHTCFLVCLTACSCAHDCGSRTWYTVVMLLFNLAKGVALAATRIVYMVFLNFAQFAIIDKTTFPSGMHGMDPAYASFVALVHFTCKYRNPIMLSLFSQHLTERARREEEQEAELTADHIPSSTTLDHGGDPSWNSRAEPNILTSRALVCTQTYLLVRRTAFSRAK